MKKSNFSKIIFIMGKFLKTTQPFKIQKKNILRNIFIVLNKIFVKLQMLGGNQNYFKKWGDIEKPNE